MHNNWKTITSLEDLEGIKNNPNLQLIFKHSTRCGISLTALSELEDNWDLLDKDYELHYLDLLNYRSLSAEIAKTFDIIHQSPQLISIRNGKVEKVLTHFGIKASKIAL